MNKKVEDIIIECISEMTRPDLSMRRAVIAQKSYAYWSANELLAYVREHNDISAVCAIENFISKMDEFSCVNPDTSFMFSVAHDTAQYILDVVMCKL